MPPPLRARVTGSVERGERDESGRDIREEREWREGNEMLPPILDEDAIFFLSTSILEGKSEI